jgi:biotin synthase-like enzyme
MYWITTDEQLSPEECEKIVEKISDLLGDEVMISTGGLKPMSKEERKEYVAELASRLDTEDEEEVPSILGSTEMF